jgi:hypothetical protein
LQWTRQKADRKFYQRLNCELNIARDPELRRIHVVYRNGETIIALILKPPASDRFGQPSSPSHLQLHPRNESAAYNRTATGNEKWQREK